METISSQFQPIEHASVYQLRPQIQSALLVGVFFNASSLRTTHQMLLSSGYQSQDVSLAMTTYTWQKQFLGAFENEAGIHENEKEGSEHDMPSEKREEPDKIKALIRRSRYVPGLDVILAGPLGQLQAIAEDSRNNASIIRAFQNWGLPKLLSEQFEKVVLCGGILMGVGQTQNANDKEGRANPYPYLSTNVRLLTADSSMHE